MWRTRPKSVMWSLSRTSSRRNFRSATWSVPVSSALITAKRGSARFARMRGRSAASKNRPFFAAAATGPAAPGSAALSDRRASGRAAARVTELLRKARRLGWFMGRGRLLGVALEVLGIFGVLEARRVGLLGGGELQEDVER